MFDCPEELRKDPPRRGGQLLEGRAMIWETKTDGLRGGEFAAE
jgi:hypothetical protein